MRGGTRTHQLPVVERVAGGDEHSAASPPEPEIRGIDRFLTFGSLTLAALSVLCFFTIILGTAFGMKQADFTHGAWPIVGGSSRSGGACRSRSS